MTEERRSKHYNTRAPLRLQPLPRPSAQPCDIQTEATEDWIHEWNQPADDRAH